MNIEEFFKMYKSKMVIKESDDFSIMGLPFFHLGHDEGIALRFSYDSDRIVISDCHTTTDYLDANNIDLDDYSDKLVTIMHKFNIYLDGNVFRKIIYDDENHNALCREVGYFIEALSLISHIDL